MNITKLELKEYKNKNELCEVLGIKKATGGRNIKLQNEELARYFKWEKTTGHKLKVTEIYAEPLPKIDDRVNNGQNPNSHHNQSEGTFSPLLQKLLKDYFAYAYKDNDNHIFFTTNNQLGIVCGLFNGDYQVSVVNKKECLQVLKKMRYKNIHNAHSFWDFIKLTERYKTYIRYTLEKLQEENLIEFEYNYIVATKIPIYKNYYCKQITEDEAEIIEEDFEKYEYKQDIANNEQMKIIKEIEAEVLEQLNVKDFISLRYNNKLEEYYKIFHAKITGKIDCDEIYKGYKINLLSNFKKCTLLINDKTLIKEDVNNHFIDSLLKSVDKKIDKVESLKEQHEERMKDKKTFGSISPKLQKKLYVLDYFYREDFKLVCKYILSNRNEFMLENLIKEQKNYNVDIKDAMQPWIDQLVI